jgi:hypothetical protein
MKKRDFIFAVLGIVLILTAGLCAALPRLKQHTESVECGNYMASIGYAARMWAGDNTNFLPCDFLTMSNELNTPRILICPADHSRQPATSWASFSPTNCTYQILTPGAPYNDTNAFFRCLIHDHLGYADGSVFDGTRRRTKTFW